jgi:Bifunctional DNA primase/polymerase, N-terminal
MTLATAMSFARWGVKVLPVGPNKRPWTPHGVYSASAHPSTFACWDWNGADCAIPTGEPNGIDVLDVDVRGRPIVEQGASLCAEGVNGFETLEALGLAALETLCASTPNGGKHFWFRHIGGSRSKDLGPGLQWFSDKKLVVVPPAKGRAWLNSAEIAEAPEALKRLVLAEPKPQARYTPRTLEWMAQRRNSSAPPLGANNGLGAKRDTRDILNTRIADVQKPPLAKSVEPAIGEVPKAVYLRVLRLTPMLANHDQRRVIRALSVLINKRHGRNSALHWASCRLEELMDKSGACELLVEASKLNGYLDKDGEEAMQQTIMSGLKLKEWPLNSRGLENV